MRGTECISKRTSEQLSHSCSEMRPAMHSIGPAPHVSQCAHSMRRPPHHGRRMELSLIHI
eukprot:6704174-Lingulodinium_polyedra.AAC.1